MVFLKKEISMTEGVVEEVVVEDSGVTFSVDKGDDSCTRKTEAFMLFLLTLMARLIRFIGKVVRQAAKRKSEQRFTTFR